jgi:hypothetical protein
LTAAAVGHTVASSNPETREALVKAHIARLAAFLLMLALAVLAEAQQPVATAPAPSAAEHIETAQTFLMAWGRQQWDDLKSVATEQVTVRVGDKTYTLQPGAGKSEVMLVFPFKGLSTVRVEGKVKGITIEELGLKVGDEEIRGPGTLTMQEQGEAFRVAGVSTGR